MTEAKQTIPAAAPERVAALALRPRQAAEALGIGVRLLWSLTNCGELPHLRLGRAVVYPIDALRAYLAERCSKAVRR